ncbi:MAG: zinc metallopeptidase [Oscillospiraceae bacterium]|nr:zinc metallopeptidase [Oscillospiraceae bacterium]
MLYGSFYGYPDWTYALIILSFLISMGAQIMVKSAFNKYSKEINSRGYTGAQAAREILDKNGLNHVQIEHVSGTLSDHFDPRSNVVRLSDSVYGSESVAAVGIAAHEVGHAIQYSEKYAPMKIRGFIVPTTQFAPYVSYLLLILGIMMSFPVLINIGIAIFCFVVFFQLITLPVEFNASARALRTLERDEMLAKREMSGAKKVLNAAAMTYVAALITAMLQLLRLIALSNRRR